MRLELAALPLALVACGLRTPRRAPELPPVVRVETPGQFGSGFFVADELIATNAHVLGNAASAMVSSDGSGDVLAEVIYRDDAIDFAVLRSPLRGVPLTIRDTPIVLGEGVVALGYPQGRAVVAASTGTVRGFSDVLILHDALIAAGSSGGPLVDDEGRVLGVNTVLAKRRGDEVNATDRGLAIRISAILIRLRGP